MSAVPLSDQVSATIDKLIAQGSPEAFSTAAKLAKQSQAAAIAATPAPPAPVAGPDPNRTLTFKAMKALTMEEMMALREEEPKVYQRSLEHLGETYDGSNRDSSGGKV